jgi:hypothetical protein
MTSFGGEVKPSVPYRKIVRDVKEPCCMKEILSRLNSAVIFRKVSPAPLVDVSDVNLQRTLCGRIRND